jgi:hypothetical protein
MLTASKDASSNTACTDTGHTFFEVKGFKDIAISPYYSGILGLAPDDPMNGPSFVAKLKTDGVIPQKTVGL